MVSKRIEKGLIIIVVILSILVLSLGGYIVYDKVMNKDNDSSSEYKKSNKKEPSKENMEYVASILLEKLDKYYVDYYDSKDSVDFSKLSDDEKMLGVFVYANGLDNLSKTVVDDYYNNLFGETLTKYPDLNCWVGDGVFAKYNSNTLKYEGVKAKMADGTEIDHAHGILSAAHSLIMKYNNIVKEGDNYIITVTKVYSPAQGIDLQSPENAFYADAKYTVKLDALTQFIKFDNTGLFVIDGAGVKSFYEQNYSQFKNLKPQYKYTFKKKNNDYYLVNYEIIR